MSEQIDSYEGLIAEAEKLGLESWRVTPGTLGSLVVRAYELGANDSAEDAKDLVLKIVKDNNLQNDSGEVA